MDSCIDLGFRKSCMRNCQSFYQYTFCISNDDVHQRKRSKKKNKNEIPLHVCAYFHISTRSINE